MKPLVQLKNCSISYRTPKGPANAVNNIDLDIQKGETLGVVGESGCGKSTLALSLIGLLPENSSKLHADEFQFEENDMLHLSNKDWLQYRGTQIGMIFQDPFSSLNPVLTISYQMMETINEPTKEKKWNRCEALLQQVKLPNPGRILNSYAHQLSGGQRQRIAIAMAIAQNPKLLIADEPTTALDVTVQAEIMNLLKELKSKLNMAVLFITHNLGLVQNFCERVGVMYAGEFAEFGLANDVLKNPKHPYTQGLLRSVPRLEVSKNELPILEGQPPDLINRPSGCAFHPRCPEVFEPCADKNPPIYDVSSKKVKCHLYE